MYSVPACVFWSNPCLLLHGVSAKDKSNDPDQTAFYHIIQLWDLIIKWKVMKRPNHHSVPNKSWSSYELQSHICPCSRLGENHAASFQLLMSLRYVPTRPCRCRIRIFFLLHMHVCNDCNEFLECTHVIPFPSVKIISLASFGRDLTLPMSIICMQVFSDHQMFGCQHDSLDGSSSSSICRYLTYLRCFFCLRNSQPVVVVMTLLFPFTFDTASIKLNVSINSS